MRFPKALTAFAIALLAQGAHASPLISSPDSTELESAAVHPTNVTLAARQASGPALLAFAGFQCSSIETVIDLSTLAHNQCLNTISYNSYSLFVPAGQVLPFQVRVGKGCLQMTIIRNPNTCTNIARAAGPFSNIELTP